MRMKMMIPICIETSYSSGRIEPPEWHMTFSTIEREM